MIVFDNRGVGASTGRPSNSMEQMADDTIAFIDNVYIPDLLAVAGFRRGRKTTFRA